MVEFDLLRTIYEFQQKLHEYLLKKELSKKQCESFIPVFLRLIKALKQTPCKPLKALGKTLTSWQEEIVRM